ncbi:MAG: hypothetical protein ACRC6V_02140 [Bacteroidales bacterium]
MQIITTRYKGPTNTQGHRIMVKSWLKNKTFDWDYSLNVKDNHKAAAQKLVDELNADRVKSGKVDFQLSIIAEGSMPDGKGNAYVIDLVEAVK